MGKPTKISGLLGILLVSMVTLSNEVSLNARNSNRTIPIVSTQNLFKDVKLANLPKIEFPIRELPESPGPYGPRRMDKKILNEFINVIYENIKPSEIIKKKFVKTIVEAESERYVYAKSKVARGLMQLIRDTWNMMEKESDFDKEAFNPYKSLRAGIKYLDHLNTRCERSFPEWNKLPIKEKHLIIAAAYNGGIGRLMKNNWDINKMPEETRLYVKKIERINSQTTY